MKVENKIDVLELNGEDFQFKPERPKLTIESHWSNRLVHVKIGEIDAIVQAEELRAAVQNASNH